MSRTPTQSIVRTVEQIHATVVAERLSLNRPVLGFGKSEVCKTDVGMYGPTEEHDLVNIVPALDLEGKNLNVLDLGSGTGKLIIPIAMLRPHLLGIWGIEFDAVLAEESRRATEIAVQRGLVRDGQVSIYQGDFFDPRFRSLLTRADRIFYYLSSSDDEDNLGHHLGNHVARPGARIVAYGDNPNPFPLLETTWGFKRDHSPETLVTTYSKEALRRP